LAAAKARGVKLGNPHLKPGDAASAREARAARSKLAREHASDVRPYIEAAREAGATSLRQIAEALTNRGVHPPSGGDRWHASQVQRILSRTA
jgi:hypothetical protein